MATSVAQAKAAIYSQLASAPTFHPSTADLFTDFTVESGDIYTVSSDSTSYSVPVYGMKLKWNGSSKVEVQNSGNVQRDPVEKMAQKKSRRGGRSYMNGNIVEDQIAGVRSTVTQLSNSWSVVVEGTGQNAHIKPAVIQASINSAGTGGTSKILLSADNIELNGETFANYFATGSITLQDVDIYEGSDIFIGDDSALHIGDDVGMYYGGTYRPFSYCLANAEVSNDKVHFTHMNGDELQIYINNDGELVFKDAEGNELSFEKAVYPGTITGIACPNGAVTDGQTRTSGTVEASGTDITNNPYSVDFSMNYESFRPQGTSIDTAAVYFMLDGVKIGRFSDGNLLQQNIKKDVVIMGITGTYEGGGGSAGTITGISCSSGAVPNNQERKTGKVKAVGTGITNSPYEVDFSMSYESFRPQGTSIDTAAVYFMLDGVKIGRFADSNLVASNIKYGEIICGITGTFNGGVTPSDILINKYNSDSPSPKRYTLVDEKNGTDADCKMGIIATVFGVEKSASFNAPVSYAYRDGYTSGYTKGYDEGYADGASSGFSNNATLTRVYCNLTSSGKQSTGKLYYYNEITKTYIAAYNSNTYWFRSGGAVGTSGDGGTKKVYYK